MEINLNPSVSTTSSPVADSEIKKETVSNDAVGLKSESEKENVHEEDFDSASEKPLADEDDEDEEGDGFLEDQPLQGEGFVDVGGKSVVRVLPEEGDDVKSSLVEKGDVLGTGVLDEEVEVAAPSFLEKSDEFGGGEKTDGLQTRVLVEEEVETRHDLAKGGHVYGGEEVGGALGTGVSGGGKGDDISSGSQFELEEENKSSDFEKKHPVSELENSTTFQPIPSLADSMDLDGDAFVVEEEKVVVSQDEEAALPVEEEKVVVSQDENAAAVPVEDEKVLQDKKEAALPVEEENVLVSQDEKEAALSVEEEKVVVSQDEKAAAIPVEEEKVPQDKKEAALPVEEEKVLVSQDDEEAAIPVAETEAPIAYEPIQSQPDSTDFSGDAAKDVKKDNESDTVTEKALDDVSTGTYVPKPLQPNATNLEVKSLEDLENSDIVHSAVIEQPESNGSAGEVSKVNGFDGQPTVLASETSGSPISEVVNLDTSITNGHAVELQSFGSFGEDSKLEKLPETMARETKDADVDENIDTKMGEIENKETAEFVSQAKDVSPKNLNDVDAITVVDEEKTEVSEAGEEESPVSERPAKIAILESSETAKQILKDIDQGSPSSSTRDYSPQIDGQIVSDSDEEIDTDEEDGKEIFDSAALAALLRAATGGSSDGNVTISAPDAARIFSVDRPAGLGSSVPLRPGPARTNRSIHFGSSDLAVPADTDDNMDEEEKKLHDKVEQIRVKFLRLVHRLGHSPEDTVAAQVLYRLGLAEGIKRGRQTSRVFSLDNAKKKAQQIEESGQVDLEFSCNILVLGKSGVGKSEIINSIFGERVANTNAFQPTTDSVKEITGIVDGVKIRFLDTPGLTPSVMDQSSNKKILSSVKKYTKKCPPDIVLYVDRIDTQTRDFNDLPLLRSITSVLGSSIWYNAIIALTHAASAPPDGPNGTPLGYDIFVAQRSHVVQHSIRQAAGDMRLMNPVALVENHPSCRRNRDGQRVLPNGITWRPQLLLLCYSSKTLSEANSLLKLQDPSPGKLFGFRVRSPPLPYLLSSLLQSRPHPKLPTDQGDNGDSDVELGDLFDSDQEEEEDEYDRLPPFKPLTKSQIKELSKEHRNAYFDEYDYRVKLLQKKQLKEEIKRMREMKKREKSGQTDAAFGEVLDDYDQDGAPASVPVPLPDMVLPPTFDCDNPAYRYRFLEPTSQLLARPVLDSHGWDHDCGYDGVSLEENRALAGRFPAGIAVQITKDKKEFNIHVDSSVAAKHGENGSTLAGFDVQSIGKQLAYIVRSETKFKNFRKNKTAAGMSVTFLGEHVATGVKVEDQILIGNRLSLVGSTGAIRSQGDMAYGANLEAKLREKDYPIGQDVSTLGLSLMKWRNDLALGANLQTQVSVGRNSKMAVRIGLNNKLTGQVSVRTSSSDQLQLALLGIIPIAMTIFNTLWHGELVQS